MASSPHPNQTLAPYAVKNTETRGRIHPERFHDDRLPFERDRDRIIHSNAFRRLAGKTQVFVAGSGDHFRTRLTHTIEVAQIARGLARALRVNEDLAEAIALAHDLGHTPFAHGGQETLDVLLRPFGHHFEHNEQSVRVVELLEDRYAAFPGLNLTRETLDGLAKHATPWDNPRRADVREGPTIEAQIANIADEIAYTGHDLDDGLRAAFFSRRDVHRLALVRRATGTRAAPSDDHHARYAIVRATIGVLVLEVAAETRARIRWRRITTLPDVRAQRTPLVGYSRGIAKERTGLARFLYRRFYCHPAILRSRQRDERVLQILFRAFLATPRLLPPAYRARITRPDPLPIVVKDYIAGMTDRFAYDEAGKNGCPSGRAAFRASRDARNRALLEVLRGFKRHGAAETPPR